MPSSAIASSGTFVACVTVGCLALAAAPAAAQVTPDKKAAAEALFEKARALDQAGNYKEACPLFAESQRIDPGLGTMLWLADCYESNGQTASAWGQFKEAAGVAAMRHDAREKVARERAAALEPKLSKLVIRVQAASAPQGLEIRRDGVVLTQAEWGLALPVDPGTHTIQAQAQGYKPWTSTVQIGASASTGTADVPALEALPPPPEKTATQASTAPLGAERAEEPEPSGTGQRVAGIVVGAAGVAALGVGGFFALHARSLYNNASCNPQNQCSPQGLQDRNDAHTQATIATVTMGVGAAALVGGAILFLTAPRGSAPATSVRVSPVLAKDELGVGVIGRW
jgi:hypothetical protein